MTKNKKVLVVAYLFPPIGGGGVQRALKMAKYLGHFGWEVHVLTVAPEHHVSLDETLLDQLPEDVYIHRTGELRLWQRKTKLAPHGKTPVVANQPFPSNSSQSNKSMDRTSSGSELNVQSSDIILKKTGKWVNVLKHIKEGMFHILKKVKQSILIPDDQILWYLYAIRRGLQVMKEHQIDIVFSTSGPYTNHLVGRYLKRKTGKPWIADFRDPWTQNMHRPGPAWRESIEERLERSVMRESDCIVTVTRSFANNFKQKFSQEIQHIEVIHNGFDREDYEQFNHESTYHSSRTSPIDHGVVGENKVNRSTPNADKCTFIYTGIFYQERNPRLLLKAVKELIDEGIVPQDQIVLQFAGVFDYPGYTENQNCVKELALEDIVEVMGHLPHRQALLAMKNADVLMLIGDTAPESGDYIPGKLFEYMAIEKPILALTLPGESANIIEQYQLGEIADPNSIQQIKTAFLKMYRQWEKASGVMIDNDTTRSINGGVPTNKSTLDSSGNGNSITAPSTLIYERKEQARMLAKLMDELTQ